MTTPSHDRPREPAKGNHSAMAELLQRPSTEDDLRENTASVAQPTTERSKDVHGLMVMRVGVERIALPARDVTRVTPDRDVHRIPHRSNEVVRGLCNIDGDLLLTAALEKLLRIPADEGPSSENTRRRMVVIGGAGARWAFAVDDVIGVRRVEAESLRDLPVTVERAMVHFARAIAPLDDGQATLLDTEAITAALTRALQ